MKRSFSVGEAPKGTARAAVVLLLCLSGFAASLPAQAGDAPPWIYPVPVPFKAPVACADVVEFSNPGAVRLGGYLGNRVALNEKNRLAKVDVEPLLDGFRHKPGVHPWIGEHIGKWLHASTLAWANTSDAVLRTKMDHAVAELIAAQEPDGYLGTYVPEKRFGLFPEADWDVWSHKYNLMGLLTYYQYTGYEPALAAARRIGDLLDRTFGERPGQRSILSAGTHVGMAATSVLEPMVLLYRHTAEPRYLEFARYIVRSWDSQGGPAVLKTLLREKSVRKTANGKAYEMLSNLVGLAELYRVTGDRSYLEAAVNAWGDVVANRLYLTGSASAGEVFQEDHDLPNTTAASICETCVTTTWIQFNSQLLRLTGDARYGNELERSFYNHLAAAQRPDGAEWCYYTALEGAKPYGPGINCCVSSGPRGMAMVPGHALMRYSSTDGDGVAVNLFEPARALLVVHGQAVGLDLDSQFPARGLSVLTVYPERVGRFGLRVRVAPWMGKVDVKVNGSAVATRQTLGWLELPSRAWRSGDAVGISYGIGARVEEGSHGNKGLEAMAWGPLILAYDQRVNPGLPSPRLVGYGPVGNAAMEPQVRLVGTTTTNLTFETAVRRAGATGVQRAVLVPFAEAGAGGGLYRVWLPAPSTPLPAMVSALMDASETRSREGNVSGSVVDGDTGTFSVTFNNQKAEEDWYAVTPANPIRLRKVTFAHGKSFHDGGWFDVTGGKPRVEIQRTAGGAWECVGRLDDYPATTALSDGGLRQGQAFSLSLAAPVQAVALRVVGRPACGDNPNQAFSSCAEISVETAP